MSEHSFSDVKAEADSLKEDIGRLIDDLEGVKSSYDIAYQVIDTLRSYLKAGEKTVSMVKMFQGLKSGISGIGRFFGKGD